MKSLSTETCVTGKAARIQAPSWRQGGYSSMASKTDLPKFWQDFQAQPRHCRRKSVGESQRDDKILGALSETKSMETEWSDSKLVVIFRPMFV